MRFSSVNPKQISSLQNFHFDSHFNFYFTFVLFLCDGFDSILANRNITTTHFLYTQLQSKSCKKIIKMGK
ncbi:unnamed protein product [Brugia timori]|uniref:Ovule protein n=1 Tax=Brugia timori TaxID=42155 RepID=A0A0R3Q5R8_9BILA|nr:unnamed protein product [Brugia timori]